MRNLIVALLIAAPTTLMAQTTAQQEVRMEIRRVNAIQIHGMSTLAIPARSAASAPVVSRSTASYAITTNEMNRRIVVSLDAPMPEGTKLTITMAAPKGGQSIEGVALSTEPQTAVTGISQLNERGLAIEYALTAAPGNTARAATTRTVSLTLVSGV